MEADPRRVGAGSLGRAFGLTLASMAVLPLFSFLAPKAGILPERLWRPNVPLTESFTILSVFVAFANRRCRDRHPGLASARRTLLAYGLAARIPVALLMLVAMLGNWGTTTTPAVDPPDERAWVWVGSGWCRSSRSGCGTRSCSVPCSESSPRRSRGGGERQQARQPDAPSER